MTTQCAQPLTYATFGELLRRWRRSQRLKQCELGKLLQPKARAATISCWENDIRRPSRKYLSQIVALTGIPVELALSLPQREDAAHEPRNRFPVVMETAG